MPQVAASPTERRIGRRLLIAGLPLIIIAVLLSSFWLLWLPEYRPALETGESYGVDVSNHQGSIDWAKVRSDRISFAYLKATEGGDFVDATFQRNWTDASTAGVRRGAYHFFTFCTDGEAQARNFLPTVPIDSAALPAALDVEVAGNCSQRPARADMERQVLTWIDVVERATGKPVLLYVDRDFDERYASREWLNGPRWERRLWQRPNEPWSVWQFSHVSHVKGVPGRVDLNIGVIPD